MAVGYVNGSAGDGSTPSERGRTAALDDLDGAPTDLAVEIEHTRLDQGKRRIYRDAGVRELWELATEKSGRRPAIFDLQAVAGHTEVEQSSLFPGVQAKCLPEAVSLLREIGGYGEFRDKSARGEPVVQQLLATAGVAE